MVAILDELLGEQDGDKIYKDLEMILRIKAVQDVSPSKAAAFTMALKSIIQKRFQKEINSGTISVNDLLEFYDTLDSIALIAFNIYTESRELIMICVSERSKNATIFCRKLICLMNRWILARLCVAVTI